MITIGQSSGLTMSIRIGLAVFLGLVVLLDLDSVARAQSKPTLDFLFVGVREERERLKSGICKIEGSMVTRSKLSSDSKGRSNQGVSGGSVEELSGPCDYFIAFDGADFYRFDRSEPGFILDRSAEVESAVSATATSAEERVQRYKNGQEASKFCTNPEKAAWWNSESMSIDLMNPASVRLGQRQGFFDVRCLGLCSLHTLLGKAVGFNEYIDEQLGLLKKKLRAGNVEVNSVGTNVHQIVLRHDNREKSEWLLDIAIDQGFSATRSVIREKDGMDRSKWVNTEEINVAWDFIGGVWLPVEFKAIVLDVNAARSEIRQPKKEINWTLHWSNVNEEIDKSLFTYESFGAKESVRIVDISNRSQPILVRERFDNSQQDEFSFIQWSMLVLLVAVILGGVFAWMRWRTR